MEERKVFTLLQVCASIRKRVEEATHGQHFWIKAEIAGINSLKHVYLDLVQHQEGARVAVLRGIIWQQRMRGIRELLGEDLHNVLKEGSEILFCATVQYSPLYGLSLHIEEVDLAYNLGELERRKKATIDTLRMEGLYDLNRSLPEPLVIQRVALIASIGSAAYADFMQHLAGNEYGYRFHVHEFPSAVQGEGAAQELCKAMARIDPALFDAVVLIRGGGSKLDLEAFNDLTLCRLVARMPIPVMTGIGHDVDVSVVDLLAKSPHKTPTAIADHLIDKCLYFETALNGSLVSMQRTMAQVFSMRKEQLSTFAEMTRIRPIMRCQNERGTLHNAVGSMARTATEKIRTHDRAVNTLAADLGVLPLQRLKQVEAARIRELRITLDQYAQHGLQLLINRVKGMNEAIQLLAPDKVMARGFSIARQKGRPVTNVDQLQVGDTIETTFAQGRARSTINTIEPHG